jgi:hypothetical protein
VLRRKDLGAAGLGPLVERTMGTKVVAPSAVRRLPQVRRLIWILGPPGLLCLEPSPRQIAIQQTWHNGVHDQRGGRARADPVLTPTRMICRVRDRTSGDLRLVGGTGWARSGSRDSTHENCGVFTAGSCTIVTWTLL